MPQSFTLTRSIVGRLFRCAVVGLGGVSQTNARLVLLVRIEMPGIDNSKLPTDKLHQFLSRPEFVNRGFEMLHALHSHMGPSNLKNRLVDVKHLSSLAMKPGKNVSAYMLNICILSNRLSSVLIDTLMPLFEILGSTTPDFRVS